MATDDGKLTDIVICADGQKERFVNLAFRDLKLTDDQRTLLDQCLFDLGAYLTSQVGFSFVAMTMIREEEEE
mgnify:CR=1 FL=1